MTGRVRFCRSKLPGARATAAGANISIGNQVALGPSYRASFGKWRNIIRKSIHQIIRENDAKWRLRTVTMAGVPPGGAADVFR